MLLCLLAGNILLIGIAAATPMYSNATFYETLLVCFSRFLIYRILSIRERVLQFGIFRAMGMRMSSIVSLVVVMAARDYTNLYAVMAVMTQ